MAKSGQGHDPARKGRDFRGFLRLAEQSDQEAIDAVMADAFEAPARRLGFQPSPVISDYGPLVRARFVLVAAEQRGRGALLGVAVTRPRDGDLYVEAFAVATAAQGSGVGRALMAETEALASALCYDWVRLHTPPSLRNAARFYRATGFHEVGRAGEGASARAYLQKRVISALTRLLA